MERIGETVAVIASFSSSCRLQPMRFRWGNRLYTISEVTYTWKSSEGRALLYHFSVSAEGNIYQLSFNIETLLWTLEAVDADPPVA